MKDAGKHVQRFGLDFWQVGGIVCPLGKGNDAIVILFPNLKIGYKYVSKEELQEGKRIG